MIFIKKHSIFIIILCLGTLFRLINLDKETGLWYDEITIYSIASQKSFLAMINEDLHRFLLFPLYYIIYHFWISIFGNSDLIIRMMSVIFDVAAIIVAYFAGKELAKLCKFEANKTGLIFMSLYSINSLFIYYAQEAKFYSLSLLFVTLILLFWLKYLNVQNLKNFLGLYFSCLLLILTYTSQVLLVILFYITTFIYFLIKKINLPTKQLIIFPTIIMPVIIFCQFVPNYFSGNFDAVAFDFSFILVLLQNFFSPILNSLQNNSLHYETIAFKNLFNITFLLFVVYPVVFMLISGIKSLKNCDITRYLFAIALSYIAIHILLTLTTNYNVLVRYCLLVLPIILSICALSICKQKKLIAFGIYITICIFIIFSPMGVTQIARPDGYKQLAQILIENKISPSSDFVLPIRTSLLDKYFLINGNRNSLYVLNNEDFQKTYLTEEEMNDLKNNSNKFKIYKRFFKSKNISKDFEKLVSNNFIKDKPIVLITDKTICIYSNEQIQQIADSTFYNQVPLQFLRLSKLNNDLFTILKKKMKLISNIETSNWEISIFEPY
ncbi:glycosyltransferase family 39 protein [bacterium]|nr:glycosyltransferase family 39 protein [bacterium]